MTNEYNVFKSIDNIYNNKVGYETAEKAGDMPKAEQHRKAAQRDYWQMIQNGYGDLASEINNSTASETVPIRSHWGKYQKTPIRPYLSKLAGQYKTESGDELDVNKYIGYDEETGDVNLGGKNIGKGYSEVDGVTYWDPEELKTRFNSFVKDIGAYKTDEQVYKTGTENGMDYISDAGERAKDDFDTISDERRKLNEDYRAFYEQNMNMNPWETEWGRAIMQRYSNGGAAAANNAVASAAGANGGNIDSFAAANAARQNLAYENAGNEAVMNMWTSKMTNAYNILKSLSRNADSMREDSKSRADILFAAADRASKENQRMFDNVETRKNNAQKRDVEVSGMTGYINPDYLKMYNPYFDKDGNVYTDIDYKAEIERMKLENDAMEKENESTSDSGIMSANNRKIAENEKKIKSAEFARSYKVRLPEYRQYAAAAMPIEREETADRRSLRDTLSSNESVSAEKTAAEAAKLDANNKSKEAIADAKNKTELEKAKLNNEAKLSVAEKNAQSKKEVEEVKNNKQNEKIVQTVYDKIAAELNKDDNNYIYKSDNGGYNARGIDLNSLMYKLDPITFATESEKKAFLKLCGFNDRQISLAKERYKNNGADSNANKSTESQAG